ncbi:HD domain-containing protein [Salipiger mangrovisoli]|uniref:HD domain-containing protein n=1 Tax=Salipiger mangrovisoli TaxID=2865933 RepID=A0ABR9WVM4_9RHOB|nr:HD domain-containing protein [Salipiger mangrovisoli]MBE9635344.1 HD domain-containing protein [Salipiger mangrovisoli]
MSPADTSRRLDAQMAFLIEAGRLSAVTRATKTSDGARFENSAEHSWHLALFALVLGEHAPEGVTIERVIKMLLLHDLVEIDAGDNPFFGEVDEAAKEAEEAAAADRLFGLLPADQGAALRALWDEFEANATPDARFAKSVDRFQPPNMNLVTEGGSWVDYKVTWPVFERKMAPKIQSGAPKLWDWLAPKVEAFLARLSH